MFKRKYIWSGRLSWNPLHCEWLWKSFGKPQSRERSISHRRLVRNKVMISILPVMSFCNKHWDALREQGCQSSRCKLEPRVAGNYLEATGEKGWLCLGGKSRESSEGRWLHPHLVNNHENLKISDSFLFPVFWEALCSIVIRSIDSRALD